MNYVIFDDNNKILDYREDERFIHNLQRIYPDKQIISTNREITVNPITGETCFRYEILDDIEEERKKEIAMLNMTRLDFCKALNSIGIQWSTIKELMKQYPQVEEELMMCSNVYRGNELLDQMAALIDPSITHEVLDQLFIKHKFEQEFNNISEGDL